MGFGFLEMEQTLTGFSNQQLPMNNGKESIFTTKELKVSKKEIRSKKKIKTKVF